MTQPGRLVAPRLTMTDATALPRRTLLSQHHPAVAYGDGVYLIVWQEGFSGVGGESAICALAIDRNGKPVYKTPFAINPGGAIAESPAVAYCDGKFIVTWAHSLDGTSSWQLLCVGVSRKQELEPILPSGSLILGQRRAGKLTFPAIASNGKGEVLVVCQDFIDGHFSIRGTRLERVRTEPGGWSVHPLDQEIMARGERPSVAWTGSNYIVCQKGYAAMVSQDGKVQVPTTQPWAAKLAGLTATAASAWGKGFIFTNTDAWPDPWGWQSTGAIIGVSMTPEGVSPERGWAAGLKKTGLSEIENALSSALADGRIVNCLDAARWLMNPAWPMGMRGGLKHTEGDSWPNGKIAAAYNGRSMVVVWPRAHMVDNRRLSNRELYLTRILPDWGMVDRPAVKLVGRPLVGPEPVCAPADLNWKEWATPPPGDIANPVLAAGLAGQTLLAYEKVEKDGVAIEYRLLNEAEDREPPKVAYVLPMSDTKWILAFDKPIDAASIKRGNFQLEEPVSPGLGPNIKPQKIALSSVVLNPDVRGLQREVILIFPYPVMVPPPGTNTSIAVTGVKDRTPAGNATKGEPFTFIAKPGEFLRGDFIEHWAVAGPFKRDVKNHPFDVATTQPSPGDTVDAKVYSGAAGGKWIDLLQPVLEFGEKLGELDQAMAYANTYCYSDRAREAIIRVDSNDHNRVWLNGKMVHDDITAAKGSRGFHDYADAIPVTLAAGWNQVLIQVDNLTGTWVMSAQITDRAGVPIRDLTWQADRPGRAALPGK